MSLTDSFARTQLAHLPTPLEPLSNLSRHLGGPAMWIKRDDCTGLAFGGNKARQLEFYTGQAVAAGADTLLTTGAVQSNHVRMTVAAARKLGLEVEVQLEHRVDGRGPEYTESGNPFLVKLMGARVHHYPVGDDEDGADAALEVRARELEAEGRRPYVIPLSGNHTPYGALGYVDAAEELLRQQAGLGVSFDAVVVGSGSANTHAGLLAGLRASGCSVVVQGICVRRSRALQESRVLTKLRHVMRMIGCAAEISDDDVLLDERSLAPGYGQLNDAVTEAIQLAATLEGVLLDPTYTGKVLAGLIGLCREGRFMSGQNVVFLHTGGGPGLFGYVSDLS